MPILFASSVTIASTPNTICGTQGARKAFTLGRLETTSNDVVLMFSSA